MIAMLRGIVVSRLTSSLILDVHGVGYKVVATMAVFENAVIGQELTVYTYTHVREDALELYGFMSSGDLVLFEKLIGVSGVGPKTALGVFSVGSYTDIMQAIMRGDTTFFQGVPRLGKKNAQKIIIELKGKLSESDLSENDGTYESDDVVLALQSFGFSLGVARKAANAVTKDGLTTAQRIKLSLQYLGK